MPLTEYIDLRIGGRKVEIDDPENVINISYNLEDSKDFQSKRSSELLNLKIPATTNNDKIANQYWSAPVEDLTDGERFKEPQDVSLIAGGVELLKGKAFLKTGKHKKIPTEYDFDLYGNNGDWMIALRETTLYDVWKQLGSIPFTKEHMMATWDFNGDNYPYVFAPVRYGQLMGRYPSLIDGVELDDYNMYPGYMKPSISKRKTILLGFKLIGYTVKSDFLNLDYFKRQVMPWTWGAFLESDGTKMDVLKFLAMSRESFVKFSGDANGFIDVKASNDYYNGGFDNKDTYHYDATNLMMLWQYPYTPPLSDFGTLDATFHLNVYVDSTIAGPNTQCEVIGYWYLNGVEDPTPSTLVSVTRGGGNLIGRDDKIGNFEDYRTFTVSPGDRVGCKIYLRLRDSSVGRANVTINVDQFEIAYFRIALGGIVNFENLENLKNWKFLDFLAGVIDEFDMIPQTDSSAKVLYLEPAHPYALGNNLSAPTGGYFNGKMLNWEDKQDLEKESDLDLFTESERELYFKYKDDNNDGVVKKAQDRDLSRLAMGKYVFPTRFKAGKKDIENRFFSACIHYDVAQWKFGGFDAPQMVVMQPENISNTSAGEAQNTLLPKSCYYKGKTSAYKWVFDGVNTHPYPYMFAVNYKPGGENDPILSYCDEQIGDETAPVVGIGLLRRFYLTRLSIMRNGQYYKTWIRLNNNDVSNFLHREHIILNGQKWELAEINGYNPLADASTSVLLRKHAQTFAEDV